MTFLTECHPIPVITDHTTRNFRAVNSTRVEGELCELYLQLSQFMSHSSWVILHLPFIFRKPKVRSSTSCVRGYKKRAARFQWNPTPGLLLLPYYQNSNPCPSNLSDLGSFPCLLKWSLPYQRLDSSLERGIWGERWVPEVTTKLQITVQHQNVVIIKAHLIISCGEELSQTIHSLWYMYIVQNIMYSLLPVQLNYLESKYKKNPQNKQFPCFWGLVHDTQLHSSRLGDIFLYFNRG